MHGGDQHGTSGIGLLSRLFVAADQREGRNLHTGEPETGKLDEVEYRGNQDHQQRGDYSGDRHRQQRATHRR